MVVVALQPGLYGEGVQQLAGDAGVLGQDEVGLLQHVQGPQGDVAQVPDRGGHQIEASLERLVMTGEDHSPSSSS